MEYDDVEVRFDGNIVADVEQLASVELSIVVTLLYNEYVEWHGGLLHHGWHELVQMFCSTCKSRNGTITATLLIASNNEASV